MATSSAVKGGQDMVVSIRYRNDLPPPPMPPKLLDIDNGGLSQYLTTSFAAAMARREEPNIEADAEGGMPIDMIGVPGYFLGDESAIMAPEIQPVLDPADNALLLTPDQLRNQDAKSNNVSFLRRTQYMTSQNARANDPLIRTNPRLAKASSKPTHSTEILARDDKENIRRHLQKGFDLAYPESVQYNGPDVQSQAPTSAEREAWRNPIHPDNPSLKPVSFFPLLPDFDTLDDTSGLFYVKFDKPPLPALQGRRDDRIDVAMINGTQIESLQAAHQAKVAAFEKNPDIYEDPGRIPSSFSLAIPHNANKVSEIRKILNDADVDHDDPDLFIGLQGQADDNPDQPLGIEYDRIRTYVNVDQSTTTSGTFYGLSLYDPVNSQPLKNGKYLPKQRAAYYHPVNESLRFKSDRTKVAGGFKIGQIDEADLHPFDVLSVRFKKLDAVEKKVRATTRAANDSSFKRAYTEIERDAAAQEASEEAVTSPKEAQDDVTMQGTATSNDILHEENDGMVVD